MSKPETDVARRISLTTSMTIQPSYFRRLLEGGDFELRLRCHVTNSSVHRDGLGEIRAETVTLRAEQLLGSPKKVER